MTGMNRRKRASSNERVMKNLEDRDRRTGAQ